jgi:hypothetical protein
VLDWHCLRVCATIRHVSIHKLRRQIGAQRTPQELGEGALFKLWAPTVTSYRTAALVAFVASVTLCACAVFLLVMRTQPLDVDFCRASFWGTPLIGQQLGIFHYTSSMYFNWTGRWAGVGVETVLLTTTTMPGAYPWLVFMLIATQCLLLYFAIWELVANAGEALYLSALIASIYWATMPSPKEGIFWVTGTVESQLALTLGLLLFALVLARRPTDTEQSTRLATIGASVLGFVIPAFHELAGGVLVLALSAITVTAFLSNSYRRKLWLIVWTASVIGFVIVFVAPGNAVRMATLPTRGRYLAVIKESFWVTAHYVLPWCLDFKHWLLAVLFWFDPRVASLREKYPGLRSFRAISGFALVWISLIMLATASTIWNLGFEPPPRTMDLIYGIFLIGWMALAFLVMPPDRSFSLPAARRTVTLSTALLLLSALVVTSSNTVGSIGDIVWGRASSWDMELNRRSALLKSAGRNADVLVPPLSQDPHVLATFDISQKPDGWSNRCLAQYFGVGSVRIAETSK